MLLNQTFQLGIETDGGTVGMKEAPYRDIIFLKKETGMTRNINIILFNIIWLTALIQSCQSKIDSDFASVKSAIDSQNAAYVKAYNNKDAESVAALHTADATVMPPNQKISQGKREIQNSINAEIQAGGRDLKFQQLELVVSGNIALGLRYIHVLFLTCCSSSL